MNAMPGSYSYQRYPYYGAPAGNAFMQPRGFSQMAQQQMSNQQAQAYQQPHQHSYQQSYQQPYQQSYQQSYQQPYQQSHQHSHQQPYQTLPMQLNYQQAQQLQYAQPYQSQQAWQTLPEYVGGGNNYEFQGAQGQFENTGMDSGRVEEVPSSGMSSMSMQQPQAWNPSAPASAPNWVGDSTSPTWRRSFEPITGRPGCYNKCRPSCSNANGGCQPTCRSACNIKPSCPRRSEVQYAGSTMVCARPGYNFQGAQGPFYGQQQQQQQQLQQQQNMGYGGGWYDANAWGGAANQGYQAAANQGYQFAPNQGYQAAANQGYQAPAQVQITSSAKLSKAPSKSEVEVVDEAS